MALKPARLNFNAERQPPEYCTFGLKRVASRLRDNDWQNHFESSMEPDVNPSLCRSRCLSPRCRAIVRGNGRVDAALKQRAAVGLINRIRSPTKVTASATASPQPFKRRFAVVIETAANGRCRQRRTRTKAGVQLFNEHTSNAARCGTEIRNVTAD
jgi:hypothetical protein